MVALPERISASPDEREWSRAGAGRTDRNAHAHAKTQADDEDRRGPAVPGRAGPHASPRRGASRPFGRADRHHEPRCFTDGHVDDGLADQPDVTACRARRGPSGIAVADRAGWMVAKPISRERLAEHKRGRTPP